MPKASRNATRPRRKGYGQFCPVAKAAEIIAERWTPLVLRELLCGSHRFNELRRGVPLMSPSLLSRRLKELEGGGVVERQPTPEGGGWEYHLTPAGEELRPIIQALGKWGSDYVQTDIDKDDLDPSLLMWDVRRWVDGTQMADDRRTVVEFELRGVPANRKRWWLVFDHGEVDLCMKRPGYGVDLNVRSTLRLLTEIWMGHVAIPAALRARDLELEGPKHLVRSFAGWFRLSPFARARG